MKIDPRVTMWELHQVGCGSQTPVSKRKTKAHKEYENQSRLTNWRKRTTLHKNRARSLLGSLVQGTRHELKHARIAETNSTVLD